MGKAIDRQESEIRGQITATIGPLAYDLSRGERAKRMSSA